MLPEAPEISIADRSVPAKDPLMQGVPQAIPHRDDPVAGLDEARLRRLIERADGAPLFAHAYSHHLNLRLGKATPNDLIRFAEQHGLTGLKIHVEDGEERSLLGGSKADRRAFGHRAAERGIEVHVETSSTARADLNAAVAVARDVAATSIRCYPRYEGRVSDIIKRTILDLKVLDALDPERRFRFTLEQHEDLKSHELVRILREVENPRLTLLFDFGNMINAYETPEAALTVMAPLVTEVHVKDVKILADRGGWAHLACKSGEGDIDFHGLLRDLLLLGDKAAQVKAFALEEENGMYAPAYRFPDEPADPFIPARGPSETGLPGNEQLDARLARERDEADRQVVYVRGVLTTLRDAARARLEAGVGSAT